MTEENKFLPLRYKVKLYLINMRFKLILLLTFVVVIIANCSRVSEPPIKEYIYVTVKDTVKDDSNIARLVAVQHELELTRDSLSLIKDSLGSDLFVANYKLARIKEYNKIAGKGNNIKYLRGWINRVLKDE